MDANDNSILIDLFIVSALVISSLTLCYYVFYKSKEKQKKDLNINNKYLTSKMLDEEINEINIPNHYSLKNI